MTDQGAPTAEELIHLFIERLRISENRTYFPLLNAIATFSYLKVERRLLERLLRGAEIQETREVPLPEGVIQDLRLIAKGRIGIDLIDIERWLHSLIPSFRRETGTGQLLTPEPEPVQQTLIRWCQIIALSQRSAPPQLKRWASNWLRSASYDLRDPFACSHAVVALSMLDHKPTARRLTHELLAAREDTAYWGASDLSWTLRIASNLLEARSIAPSDPKLQQTIDWIHAHLHQPHELDMRRLAVAAELQARLGFRGNLHVEEISKALDAATADMPAPLRAPTGAFSPRPIEGAAYLHAMASGAPDDDKNISVSGPTVFIGHGRSKLWYQLQAYLQNDLGIKVTNYERNSRSSEHIIDVLKKFTSEATFAVIVMTAEDEMVTHVKRTRQNVVHELGFFQGTLGFSKVAILKQNGVEEFTNIDGLQYIPFSGEDIRETFHDLTRMLKREGQIL